MRTLVANLTGTDGIRRGDDYKYRIVLIDEFTKRPVDLSAATAVEFMVKASFSDEDSAAVIHLSVDDGITIQSYTDEDGIEFADAAALITITDDQTSLLTGDSYVYDFVYNNSDSERYTAVVGTISPLQQVNRGN